MICNICNSIVPNCKDTTSKNKDDKNNQVDHKFPFSIFHNVVQFVSCFSSKLRNDTVEAENMEGSILQIKFLKWNCATYWILIKNNNFGWQLRNKVDLILLFFVK